MEYCNYLGRLITNETRCTCDIKTRTAMTKSPIKKERALFTRKLGLNLRKKPVKCYIWSTDLYDAET
jgi:hypothetical protein